MAVVKILIKVPISRGEEREKILSFRIEVAMEKTLWGSRFWVSTRSSFRGLSLSITWREEAACSSKVCTKLGLYLVVRFDYEIEVEVGRSFPICGSILLARDLH